ncbi:MAG: acyl-CoA dehydrogenase [Myxococcales bacterium]|nr:acyl-CoA dehydrogenase [Myxococcales bacterium]
MSAGRLGPFFEERHEALAARAEEAAGKLDGEEDPRRIVEKLAAAGLLAHCVPSEFAHGNGNGNGSIDVRDLCVIRRALGYRSSLADTMFAMQGLGSFPVTLAGSEDQRRALLPRVARGEAICAFAITEPEAGSDVSAVATRARRGGDHYLLDGEKTFISNAGIADSYVVFARTSDDRHRGLTAFLVDGAAPGLTTTPIELIAPHPIGRLMLQDCPGERIGDEGDGFRIAMATLDRFRTSVGAAAAGMAARALDEAIARVKVRRQFGKPLAEQQATQLALAEMALDLEAADLLVAKAAWLGDRGDKVTRAAAMAKLHATEAAQRVIDRALQLHGGLGVVRGTVVERLYREVRALRIYEGTSEIQKLVIARDLLR